MLKSYLVVLQLALVASTAGCASSGSPSPAQPVAAATGCGELREQIALTEATRRAAEEKEADAWKVVVPFAAIGRYVSARKEAGEANETLSRLQRQSERAGCGRS